MLNFKPMSCSLSVLTFVCVYGSNIPVACLEEQPVASCPPASTSPFIIVMNI